MTNTLYYGDNLHYLREMGSHTVDLVYLDPPFNSQATYNLLFKDSTGGAVQASTTAFRDTFKWDIPAEEALAEILSSGSKVAVIIRALHSFLGNDDLMAYLVMMTPRLIQLHRVIKRTGSLFLHCDPVASHYLKVIMDGIFEAENFRNEIIWQRSTGKALATKRLANNHDVILCYRASKESVWNSDAAFLPYDHEHLGAKHSTRRSRLHL